MDVKNHKFIIESLNITKFQPKKLVYNDYKKYMNYIYKLHSSPNETVLEVDDVNDVSGKHIFLVVNYGVIYHVVTNLEINDINDITHVNKIGECGALGY